jgi:hypothetical protein
MKASMLVMTLITAADPAAPCEDLAAIACSAGWCARTALVAAGQHRDLARPRLVHAAGHRAFEHGDALRSPAPPAVGSRRGQACSSRSRCHPCETGEDAVGRSARFADRRRRQAGDDGIAARASAFGLSPTPRRFAIRGRRPRDCGHAP